MVADHAMQEAIAEKTIFHADTSEYTPEQKKIIERFRHEMAAAGALLPTWWTSSSSHEIAKAGVDAVRKELHQSLSQDPSLRKFIETDD